MQFAKSARIYRAANRVKVRAQEAAYRNSRPDVIKARAKIQRERIKAEKPGYAAQHDRASKAKLKREVFEAYGGIRCACCGIDDIRFLTLDHIDNNGAAHRRELSRGVYRWCRKNGYPPGFQVLCMCCNVGKYANGGVCPHKKPIDWETLSYIQQWALKRKQDIIDHYGGKCQCCHETHIRFLSIDHIANNGAAHRRELKISGGSQLYAWLKKNNYPPGFRLLCANCNSGRRWPIRK